MANKSILRDGYMAAVMAEMKRDAGELWANPRIAAAIVGTRLLFCFCRGITVDVILKKRDQRAVIRLAESLQPYTPARFRAALRRIKRMSEVTASLKDEFQKAEPMSEIRKRLLKQKGGGK